MRRCATSAARRSATRGVPRTSVARARAIVGFALGCTACAGRLHLPGYVHPVEESVSSFESQGHPIRVDLYIPEGKGQRHPAVIVLHGSGGVHSLVTDRSEVYAEALANRGIAAYVVHYFDAT